MTDVLDRPGTPVVTDSSLDRRLSLRRRLPLVVGALYVVPLMAIAAIARWVNIAGSPQRVDDEGTYVAQAWAVEHLGSLAPYTYWYDHPPLGWLQLAGWTSITDAFDRHPQAAVMAGREFMVVVAAASAGLLWLLARRVGLTRPGAAAAVLLFALSPLAVQFGRTVYLDNIAVAWTLAAFAFALSRRHQLASFAAAAVCFGIAVLTKETFLLLLPFLAWQLWRSAHPSTRRYTVSVAGALFALVVSFYIVYALVKNELVPGPHRVSLWDGIAFQLANRSGSGSVLDGATQAGRSVRGWLQLDPVLSVTAPIAAVLALWVRRLRPYGAALIFLLAVIFKPGYLPVPFVIALVPLAALLVAGVADAAIRHWRGRWWRWPVRVLSLGVVVLVVGAAGAIWPPQLHSLWTYDLDRPLRQAESWVAANVDPGQRILTDDAVWLDLVRDGLPRRDVVWYYKADTDSEVIARAPHGWRDYDYVLVTEGMRHGIGDSAILSRAIGNATQVAAFGAGPAAVQVYQVHPVGVDEFYGDRYRAVHGRRFGGRVLADNPRLELDRVAARQLRRGKVDGRVVTALAQELGHWRLSVSRFPAVAGETGKVPRRIVEISGVAGRPVAGGGPQVATLAEQLRGLPRPYRPERVTRDGAHLTVRFEVAQPSDVLPQPPAQ